MHLRTTLAACAVATLLAGCGGSTPTTPSDPAPPATATTVRAFADPTGGIYTTMGLFEIHVDAQTLSTSVEPLAVRAAQDNDDLYELSINSFLGSKPLKISDITLDSDTMDLTYAVTHPFDAPSNLAGPPTATNRSDLGVSGRVCLLTDVTTAVGNTYFDNGATDQVVANTGALANADGYCRPAGLISLSGYTANTFPYKVLVDELQDPRTARDGSAISNGGVMTGNYNAATLGWQQANIGAARNAWTGYGVLHQGQIATNILEIPLDSIEGGQFDVIAAVLVKYNDPRQGANAAERKSNRLPASPPAGNRFAYRMPHGAVDVERITFEGESGGFVADIASSSELRFHVTDWDSRATESATTPLSSDTAVDTIPTSSGGVPTLSVCIPGVTGDATSEVLLTPGADDDDSLYGGDVGQDSGEPDDALFYADTINKGVATGQVGDTHIGMVKAVDPGSNGDVPLDESLLPLTAEFPEPVAYQAFKVLQGGPTWLRTGAASGSGGGGATNVSVDAAGNVYVGGRFQDVIDFGQGPITAPAGGLMFLAKYSKYGFTQWVRTNNSGNYIFPADMDVSQPNTIWVCGYFLTSADFGSGVTLSTSGSNDHAYAVRYDGSGTPISAFAYGGTSDERADVIAVTPDGTGIVTAGTFFGFTDLGGGVVVGQGNTDSYVRRGLATTGAYVWGRTWGSAGSEYGNGLHFAGGGQLYFGGAYSNTINFGLGNRISAGSTDSVLLNLNPTTGVTIWDRVFGSTGGEQITSVGADQFNAPLATGYFTSPSVDFGNGFPESRVGNIDMFVVRYTDINSYSWTRTFSTTGNQIIPQELVVTATGKTYVGGEFLGTVDFGGGAFSSTPGAFVNGFFVTLSPMGGYQQHGSLTGPVITTVADIGVDPTNEGVTVVGSFWDECDLDPGPGVLLRDAEATPDVFTLKLDASGDL